MSGISKGLSAALLIAALVFALVWVRSGGDDEPTVSESRVTAPVLADPAETSPSAHAASPQPITASPQALVTRPGTTSEALESAGPRPERRPLAVAGAEPTRRAPERRPEAVARRDDRAEQRPTDATPERLRADILEDEHVRERLQALLPDLGECHRMLMEVDPDAPPYLLALFELRVTTDPEDPDRGLPQLQSITAGDLVVDDMACFAEVLEEAELPPPEPLDTDDLHPFYSVALQFDLRSDDEEE